MYFKENEPKNGIYGFSEEVSRDARSTWVLMQYTGLKDKNGVEIYESDLIKFYINFGYGEQEVVALVVWDENGFKFKSGAGIDYAKSGVGEVIGNKYSNPELLEN